MIEALIGAVAVDSNWDSNALETVADRLLCLQITHPDEFIKSTYFDYQTGYEALYRAD